MRPSPRRGGPPTPWGGASRPAPRSAPPRPPATTLSPRARWGFASSTTEGWPPDLLLVSAGFDSLNGDPLGGFTLEPEDIARWTALLRERVAPAPVVGVLEGGYRLDLLAAGARAHVRALA